MIEVPGSGRFVNVRYITSLKCVKDAGSIMVIVHLDEGATGVALYAYFDTYADRDAFIGEVKDACRASLTSS